MKRYLFPLLLTALVPSSFVPALGAPENQGASAEARMPATVHYRSATVDA